MFVYADTVMLLFVFYYLCGKGGFCYHVITHEDVSLHAGNTVAYRCQQVNFEQQRVARYYLLAEFYIVNTHEICGPALRFFQCVEY